MIGQTTLVVIRRVKFENVYGAVCLCQMVMNEVQNGSNSSIEFLFIPEIPDIQTTRLCLDEVSTVSVGLPSGQYYSGLEFELKYNRYVRLVFIEGRMHDVLNILIQRKLIVHSSNNNYTVITKNAVLRHVFLLDYEPAVQRQSAFEVVDLDNRFTKDEYLQLVDKWGRLSKPNYDHIRKQIAKRGLAQDVMCEVWGYLMEVYVPGSTGEEQCVVMKNWNERMNRNLLFADSFQLSELDNFQVLRDALSQIDKDVSRVDPVNPFFTEVKENRNGLAKIAKAHLKTNIRINYSQGMIDCVAIFLQVAKGDQTYAFAMYSKFLEENSELFSSDWSFVNNRLQKILQVLRVCNNKLYEIMNSTGGHTVTYPWIMVWMKRCFPYATIVQLWTMIMNRNLGPDTLIYFIVAILMLKAGEILAVDGITVDTIMKVYEDVSSLPLEHIKMFAEDCRNKYKLEMRNQNK